MLILIIVKEKRRENTTADECLLANVNRSTTEANYFFLPYSPVLAVKLNAVSSKQFANLYFFFSFVSIDFFIAHVVRQDCVT